MTGNNCQAITQVRAQVNNIMKINDKKIEINYILFPFHLSYFFTNFVGEYFTKATAADSTLDTISMFT